jgi:hypothetical protein
MWELTSSSLHLLGFVCTDMCSWGSNVSFNKLTNTSRNVLTPLGWPVWVLTKIVCCYPYPSLWFTFQHRWRVHPNWSPRLGNASLDSVAPSLMCLVHGTLGHPTKMISIASCIRMRQGGFQACSVPLIACTVNDRFVLHSGRVSFVVGIHALPWYSKLWLPMTYGFGMLSLAWPVQTSTSMFYTDLGMPDTNNDINVLH